MHLLTMSGNFYCPKQFSTLITNNPKVIEQNILLYLNSAIDLITTNFE